MNNKAGNNSYKRSFIDTKENRTFDAVQSNGISFRTDKQPTNLITDSRGRTYLQILPNVQQEQSDKAQLKTFPGYRLITERDTPNEITTVAPDADLIVDGLNDDVTDFLKVINDIGARISSHLESQNRNLVDENINLNNVTNNLLKGMDDLKSFFFDFGKKIAPRGVNPYHNNEFQSCNKTEDKQKANCQINVNCNDKNNVEYDSAPYNPNDINTYLNCLDTLARKSVVRETNSSYNDFNLKVFQSLLIKMKVSKFVDSSIDELNVTRPLPLYNPMQLMLEILKLDVKLFNILYLLNLHNSCRSPITGVYYGKNRTKINDKGYPVPNTNVDSTDIYNATVQMIELISCILNLITFIDIDTYNRIIEEHYSLGSVGIVQDGSSEAIVIDNLTTNSQENIPTFLYGHLMSFCDATKQTVNEIIIGTFANSPDYDPSKVANIAHNCTYGILAVGQLIESFLKSRCFLMIMSMLFPSHGCKCKTNCRSLCCNLDEEHYDMQMVTQLMLSGIPADLTKNIPPKSIPNFLPVNDPICINKAVYSAINTALCGISRFLWNSSAPCLRFSDLDELDKTNNDKDCKCSQSNTPAETTTVSNDSDLSSIKSIVAYLKNNTYQSVLTSNNKILAYLQLYVSAYAQYIDDTFNERIEQSRSIRNPTQINRDLRSLLTRGVNF